VPHPHAFIGAQPRLIEPRPGLGRAQHALAGARDRHHAQLRRRIRRARGRELTREQRDALRLDAGMTHQQGRRAGAGQAAADHDDVITGRHDWQRQAARQPRQRAAKTPAQARQRALGRRTQVEQQQPEIARRDRRAALAC
jgi:hypothetical protein